MAAYVTLVKNPKGKNPKKRRHYKRNPDALAMVQRNLPSMEEIAGGLLGATVAMQLPAFMKADKWANVMWSAIGTVGGAILLRMTGVGGSRVANAYVLGGGLVTALKGAHVATNGAFGIPPTMIVSRALAPAGTPAPAAVTGVRGGVGRGAIASGLGSIRESQFASGPSVEDDSIV